MRVRDSKDSFGDGARNMRSHSQIRQVQKKQKVKHNNGMDGLKKGYVGV